MDVQSGPAVETLNKDQYQPQLSTWARQLVIIGLLIGIVYALTLLAPVVRLLSMTFLPSLVMFALSSFLVRRFNLPYRPAVVLCYLLVIVIVGVALARFIPASADAANTLRDTAEQRYSQLQDALQHYTPDQGVVTILGIRVDLNFAIDPVRSLVLGSSQNTTGNTALLNTTDLRQLVTTMTEMLTSAVSGVTGSVSVILMALFISFLVRLDLPTLSHALPGWIPPAYHRETSLLVHQIGVVWNGFFRGQALIAVIIAVLTWLQLTLMGVQNTVVVSVFVGIISLIPTLGGIIALVPLAAIALLQGSTVFTDLPNGTFAVLVVVVNLIISQIIWNIVAPKILGDAVNLPLPLLPTMATNSPADSSRSMPLSTTFDPKRFVTPRKVRGMSRRCLTMLLIRFSLSGNEAASAATALQIDGLSRRTVCRAARTGRRRTAARRCG